MKYIEWIEKQMPIHVAGVDMFVEFSLTFEIERKRES
jgi:hypothetical protein